MRIRPLLAILSVAAVLIDFSPALAGTSPIVWNNGPALSNVGGGASQVSGGPEPFDAQAADDLLFTGGAGTTVTDVEWTGRYFNGTALPNPGPSFTIRFYADNGTGGAPTGGPGIPSATALATYTTGVGGAHQVQNAFGNWDYSYTLPTPFAASPGVKYWLSVQAVFDVFPQWRWSNSTTTQLSHAAYGSTAFPVIPYWNVAPNDVAFTLRGIPFEDCPADVSPTGGDGFVNVDDLLEVIGEWGGCASPCPEDIDANGIVNVNDLLAVITAWGPCS